MKTPDPRPVKVLGDGDRDAVFHGWTWIWNHNDGLKEMKAVIESKGGGINYEDPYRITFLDNGY